MNSNTACDNKSYKQLQSIAKQLQRKYNLTPAQLPANGAYAALCKRISHDPAFYKKLQGSRTSPTIGTRTTVSEMTLKDAFVVIPTSPASKIESLRCMTIPNKRIRITQEDSIFDDGIPVAYVTVQGTRRGKVIRFDHGWERHLAGFTKHRIERVAWSPGDTQQVQTQLETLQSRLQESMTAPAALDYIATLLTEWSRDVYIPDDLNETPSPTRRRVHSVSSSSTPAHVCDDNGVCRIVKSPTSTAKTSAYASSAIIPPPKRKSNIPEDPFEPSLPLPPGRPSLLQRETSSKKKKYRTSQSKGRSKKHNHSVYIHPSLLAGTKEAPFSSTAYTASCKRMTAGEAGVWVKYSGKKLYIPKGSRYYFNDVKQAVVIGFRGSYDPPESMDGMSLLSGSN